MIIFFADELTNSATSNIIEFSANESIPEELLSELSLINTLVCSHVNQH